MQNAMGNKSVHGLSPRYSHWDIMVDLKNDIFGKLSVKGRLKSSFWTTLRSDDQTNQEPLSLSEFQREFQFLLSFIERVLCLLAFGSVFS